MKLLVSLTLAVLLGNASGIFAQTADLQKTYAQTPEQCSSPANRIAISPGKIIGPNFNCEIANERPAGTGLWVYDASCEINGRFTRGNLGMGINMKPGPESYSISLPGVNGGGIDLHPCEPAVAEATNVSTTGWYVTPEEWGDCGEECHTWPTAWINDANGDYTFGMSCSASMVLGGYAMRGSQAPFDELDMAINDQSLGRFSVDTGLNDVYVTPTNPTWQSESLIREALVSGRTMNFNVAGRAPINFTLSGSRAAIEKMEKLCQPDVHAATPDKLVGSRWIYLFRGNEFQFTFGKNTIDDFPSWSGVTWNRLGEYMVELSANGGASKIIFSFDNLDSFRGRDWDKSKVVGRRILAALAQTQVPSQNQIVASSGAQTDVTQFTLHNDSNMTWTIAWIDGNGQIAENGKVTRPGQPWVVANGAKTWESHWYAISNSAGFICSISLRQNATVNFSQLAACQR